MAFESYKKHETDPKKESRRAKISEALDKLDTNGQIDVFEEFKAFVAQNSEPIKDEKGNVLHQLSSEDKMSVLLQMVGEQRKKPKSEEAQPGVRKEKLVMPSPRLVGAVRRALSREERVVAFEALFERQEKQPGKNAEEKWGYRDPVPTRRSRRGPGKPLNKELDRRTVRDPGAIFNEAEIHDASEDLLDAALDIANEEGRFDEER